MCSQAHSFCTDLTYSDDDDSDDNDGVLLLKVTWISTMLLIVNTFCFSEEIWTLYLKTCLQLLALPAKSKRREKVSSTLCAWGKWGEREKQR